MNNKILWTHFISMGDLNDEIKILERDYKCGIKIINICSTETGFDLFYQIVS